MVWLAKLVTPACRLRRRTAQAPLVCVERPVMEGSLTAEDIAGLDSLEFDCWALDASKYEAAAMYMFHSTGMLERFHVPMDTCR